VNNDRRCPKCGEKTLQTWEELNDDEREVVRRLPGSADYPLAERQTSNRWCTRCWHEEASDSEHTA
jgi:Zn ribbon nucleic-acid-binding protein